MPTLEKIEQTRTLNNEKYRHWYRENTVPKGYNPLLHLGFNFGTLLALMIFHFVLIETWDLKVLFSLSFLFLFGNFAVWVIHKYPLHHRYKFWTYPYTAHTIEHHRYFTADHITYDKKIDYYAIFSLSTSFLILRFLLSH